MVRIDQLLRRLDRIEPRDVWPEIERRSRLFDRPIPRVRLARPLLAAALAVVVVGATGVALMVALSVVRLPSPPAVGGSGAGDGALIAFIGTPPVEGSEVAPADGDAFRQQVFVVREDGSGLRRLVHDDGQYAAPAWAPDGTRLAVARFDPSGDASEEGIYVVNADGTGFGRVHGPREPVDVEYGGWSTVDISWSPSGRRLAFVKLTSMDTGGSDLPMELVIVDADGGPETVLEHSSQVTSVDWSPSGRLAFTEQRSTEGGGEVYDILLTDPDGRNVVRLTDDGRSLVPVWSPDGERIAFERHPRAESLERRDVYVMNADGTGVRRLTDDPGNEAGVTWSPDGTRIAFLRYRGGDACGALVELDLTTGEERVIVASELCPGSPAWQPLE